MAKNVNDKKIKQEPPKKLDDGLTKAGRRSRNVALKIAAMDKALAADLPWDDGVKALRFFEDPDAAYLEATTSVKAIPAAILLEARKQINERQTEIISEIAASKIAGATTEKTASQLLVEAAKKTLTGNTANDNTEVVTAEMEMKPDEPATETPVEEPANEKGPEPTVAPDDAPTTAPVDQPVQEGATTEVVDERARRPGESGKKYSQRIHKLDLEERRLKKAAKLAAEQAAATETRNGEPVVEGDAGNAQADLPIQKTLPKNTRLLTTDEIAWWEGRNSPVPEHVPNNWTIAAQEQTIAAVEQMKTATQVEDETKVSDELVEHGSFAAIAAAEKAEESKPVEEIPAQETPGEETAPVQTEPEMKPERTPVENKTTKKPTLTVASSTERTPAEIAAAKKFYGSAWTEDKSAILASAHSWLLKAVDADEELNGNNTNANKSPVNPKSRYRMAMNAALKYEAEAFSVSPTVLTVADIDRLYPEAATARAA